VRPPKHKVVKNPESREIIYSDEQWKLLKKLRKIAEDIMSRLRNCRIDSVTYGSVARGDVNHKSDVDVFIPYTIQPYLLETCLQREGVVPTNRYIVKATPSMSPKGYIELDIEGKATLSFPLDYLSLREWEFYKFGGLVTYEELVNGVRRPGVNKNLILILPTEEGHKEFPVIGYENYVAKVIGISIETVKERVKVLSRRDEHGRTGVFLTYILHPEESFEEALDKLNLRKI